MIYSLQDHIRTGMRDLDHPILAGAENTDSWRVRKEDSQRAFSLDVLMVPSSTLTIATDRECLSYGALSLSETIHFGSLQFIVDRFGGLSLSPMGEGSDAIVIGSACSGPPSPLRAMMGDSVEEVQMASDGEGRIDFPSPRRHDTGDSPALPRTISRPKSTPTTQATMTISPQ
jgi:hypothetical protein